MPWSLLLQPQPHASAGDHGGDGSFLYAIVSGGRKPLAKASRDAVIRHLQRDPRGTPLLVMQEEEGVVAAAVGAANVSGGTSSPVASAAVLRLPTWAETAGRGGLPKKVMHMWAALGEQARGGTRAFSRPLPPGRFSWCE